MDRRRRWLLPTAVALLAALTASACAREGGSVVESSGTGSAARADWPAKLVFAAVPAEQNERLKESYQLSLDILNDELGIDIEFFQAADYAGVIEAMIADRVDIAQFGPFSYVIAVGNGAKTEAIAAGIDTADGVPGYQSYGITSSRNADVASLKDFKGRKVCFVDPSSTSGFLYPSAGLLDAGIDPKKDVEPVFAGAHDASAISVKNGDCEVGFAFDDMVDVELIESRDLKKGDLKVVWKSDVIPGSPIAIRTGLPASLRDAIRKAVLEKTNVDYAVKTGLCKSADDCTFSDEGFWGYKAVDDAFYDGVRKVCEVTKSAECEGVG